MGQLNRHPNHGATKVTKGLSYGLDLVGGVELYYQYNLCSIYTTNNINGVWNWWEHHHSYQHNHGYGEVKIGTFV